MTILQKLSKGSFLSVCVSLISLSIFGCTNEREPSLYYKDTEIGDKVVSIEELGLIRRETRRSYGNVYYGHFAPSPQVLGQETVVSDSNLLDGEIVSIDKAGKMVIDYVNRAVDIYRSNIYRITPKYVKKGEYESGEDYRKRVDEYKKQFSDTAQVVIPLLKKQLLEYYQKWDSVIFTTFDSIPGKYWKSNKELITYDPEQEYAFIKTYNPLRIDGRGKCVPITNLIVAAAPLYEHHPYYRSYSYNRIEGISGIAIPMSPEKAKSMDINNARYIMKCTWQLSHVMVNVDNSLVCDPQNEVYGCNRTIIDGLPFPLLQLLSAECTIDNTTVWKCGIGRVGVRWPNGDSDYHGFSLAETIGRPLYRYLHQNNSTIAMDQRLHINWWRDYPIEDKVLSGETQGECDSTGTVTDIDGNVYQTIKIGKQWWMMENLKVTHFRNGDQIPHVSDDGDWSGLTSSAYCNYNNDESKVATYGRLYNWFAVNDNRNIAPEGWHVPGDGEWMKLEMYLGMSKSDAEWAEWRGTDEGGKLKETGTSHWDSPNTGATNESKFSALPGGYRNDDGCFYGMDSHAYFWTSSKSQMYRVNAAYYRYLAYNYSKIYNSWSTKPKGFSVRCVRDAQRSVIERGAIEQVAQ